MKTYYEQFWESQNENALTNYFCVLECRFKNLIKIYV